MQHASTQPLTVEQVRLPAALGAWTAKAFLAGIVLLGLALVVGLLTAGSGADGQGRAMPHFAHAYVVGYSFWLTISLGAMILVCIQHTMRSGWSVVLRRLAELTAATMPILAVLFVPILFMMDWLFPWTDPNVVAVDAVIIGKHPYLQTGFFIARWVVYFAVWIWISKRLLGLSVSQDTSGDPQLTRKLEKLGPPAILAFALTISFAMIDLWMTLDPHWFSTMFGVYAFSGAMVGFMAGLILVVRLLQRLGALKGVVTVEHYHDMGKLLFAFTLFWGYIAFCQFMLIWYANIPEETVWFKYRWSDGWMVVSLVLILGHFVIPFVGLLSRHVKRNLAPLIFWAAWQFVMHLVDIYWVVMPNLTIPRKYWDRPAIYESWTPNLLEPLVWAGVGALFVGYLLKTASDKNLVAIRDPRLGESRGFHNF